jgi:hypothetical protein
VTITDRKKAGNTHTRCYDKLIIKRKCKRRKSKKALDGECGCCADDDEEDERSASIVWVQQEDTRPGTIL